MNTDRAFVEFQELPRGTQHAKVGHFEIDVWRVYNGRHFWRWTVIDTENLRYVATGEESTLDQACETALRWTS